MGNQGGDADPGSGGNEIKPDPGREQRYCVDLQIFNPGNGAGIDPHYGDDGPESNTECKNHGFPDRFPV